MRFTGSWVNGTGIFFSPSVGRIGKARNLRLFEGQELDAQEIIWQAKRVVDGVRILLRTDRSGSLQLSL
ncbi:UNVERIFIED_CONTAM: hypothetical protein Sangu_2643700 [Sesamum angustifolium]|uniref:Uncharacterized protein n=1 Tax=Sesamum angustifolium TaxID=2727405 RepID=A0AAW2J2T2_9LAMI